MAAFLVEIVYDPDALRVDTSVGQNGVLFAAGFGGSLVYESAPGRLVIMSYNLNGYGPGTDLPLFTVSWKAQHYISGATTIRCYVKEHVAIDYATIGLPTGYGTTISIVSAS